jgi:two-component system CheB/CheR fusion protein
MKDNPKEYLGEIINESDQRFKLIIDSLPHFVWESDRDGTYSYVNQQFLDWSALTLEQIKDDGLFSLIYPEDHKIVVDTWQQALITQTEFDCEYRMKDAEGNYLWFHGKTVPVKNDQGEVIKWVGTTTNINEQKKIEDAQIESEKQFRQLADIMPQQVWTANEKGELDYVNLVTLNYFGKSEKEIIGAGWQTVIHPNDIELVLKTWVKSLLDLTPYQVEFRLKRKDDVYRWHLGRATSFVNKNNQVRWFGTNTDIELHKANEQKKDEFISMASHELKTPVTSIKAYSYILQSWFENEGNSKAAELVKKMDVQVNKLTKLIGDFLSVSRVEGQHFQLNKADFKFNDLVDECVSGVQITTPTHKLIIENNADIKYHGDRLRLEQVFSNFLSNAIKYSPDADKIIISFGIKLDNIVVSITDFGIGIEKEDLKKIFNRFYRVDNTSMKFQGLGLGLYISSEIIKAHKGSFWIESELGKGSVFYFLLPLGDNTDKEIIKTDNKTYYSDSQITIQYNAEIKSLEVDWIGFQNYDSVKKGCLIMLDLLTKNNCAKVLNDNTNVLGNWSEAADWGGTVWFPEMQRAGLQYFAWIYSASTFSKLAAHKSLDFMVGNITTQFFTDIEEAKLWLQNIS